MVTRNALTMAPSEPILPSAAQHLFELTPYWLLRISLGTFFSGMLNRLLPAPVRTPSADYAATDLSVA